MQKCHPRGGPQSLGMIAVKSTNPFAERRAFGRRETNIKAMVRAGSRSHVCTIKDISEGGALLEFQETFELPARLWLRWEANSSEILCEIRHSRGTRVGVEFSRPIVLKALHVSAPVDAVTHAAPLPAQRPLAARSTGSTDLVIRHRQALRAGSRPAASGDDLAETTQTAAIPTPRR